MKRIILVIFFIVILGFGCNTQDITIQNQQKKIDELSKSVEDLVKQNEDINKEKQATIKTPTLQQNTPTETKNNTSENLITTNITNKTADIDLAAIIKQWQSKIVHIECKWMGKDGTYIQDAFGSGLFIGINDIYMVYTNKHVLSYNGQAPWMCQMTFPYIGETYTANVDMQTMSMKDVAFDPNFDVGELFIRNPSKNLKSFPKINYCEKTADIGEQIVVLGYPGIGSPTGITATEGIISGYDNGYYITSAKVEHGNSGGVAILVKDNCYLGIPSYVNTGELESLARILNFNFLNNYYSQ